MKMDPIIDIRHLTWSFNETKVLNDISLSIKQGTFTGILGPNGAGKTTLLRLILNLLEPKKNSVIINGRDIRTYSQRDLAKNEAYVPQSLRNNFNFTVEQIVLMGRSPFLGRFDRESSEDIRIAERAMKETGVLALKNKSITTLSGGELQRVVIARALTQEPVILALDEPTSHLDIHHQINVLSIIRSLAKRKSISIIAVLHDINHALEYCDNLFLLNKGEIVTHGSPETVITPENMKNIYNLNIKMTKNPLTGNLYMIHDYT